MGQYEKLYCIMFNAATDAVRSIENCRYEQARHILVQAQRNAEEAYLEQREEAPVIHLYGKDETR